MTRAVRKHLEVELASARNRGQTVVDWNGVLKKEPKAELVLEMDSARLWELFQMGLA